VRIKTKPSALRSLGQLRVSIDGHISELQRELRGVDLAPVLASCRRLDNQDVPFWVRMTLWKRNIRALADIYSWVAANKIRRVSFFEFQSSGRGIGQELIYGVSSADVDAFLHDLITLARPACLEMLTVNFAERRLAAVEAQRSRLNGADITLCELPETPNCTINYDGTIGISPWRVTSHGAPDVFTSTTAPNFFQIIERAVAHGELRDDSGCISRVQLRFGW
jgi:MoaA/NifB/PqqE/SkfB family radical SAM enzyme